jgi:hypothetical protein
MKEENSQSTVVKHLLVVIAILSTALMGLQPLAQAANSPCNGPNGNLFNLEPRPNAVVQVARSLAVLPNPVNNNDLIVAVGADARGLEANPPIISEDAFYVQRSSSNCTADLEGGFPSILTPDNQLFVPAFGSASVVADPARAQFFIVDLDFTTAPDKNGVGIYQTTSANLNSNSACPSGTEFGTAPCFTTVAVTNISGLNAFLDNPHIAVDPRTKGIGAGDVYTVVTQRNSDNKTFHISLTACTNGLNCGASIAVSGTDNNPDFPWIQVRPDGGITISYRDTTFPGVNPEDIKFVTCTPAGAPKAPTCGSPVLVTTEKNPVFATTIGDLPMMDQLYPRHVNRLESDGKTVTTFLIYDRCDVPVIQQNGFGRPFCPKGDVVLTSSNNGGGTWSPVTLVSTSPGLQFFGAIANDTSTETVNISYYSTQNDVFQLRPQMFLAQIAPGTTTVGTPHRLTSAFADVQASPPISLADQPVFFGDRMGIAVTGTGTAGESHAYVSFTWDSVAGTYNGVPSADVNNHLTSFQY